MKAKTLAENSASLAAPAPRNGPRAKRDRKKPVILSEAPAGQRAERSRAESARQPKATTSNFSDLSIVPTRSEILAPGIHLPNQRILLLPPPTLELLLPRNRIAHLPEDLVENQMHTVVARRERVALGVAMLPHPKSEIVRHADVERRAGVVRDDVDRVVVLPVHGGNLKQIGGRDARGPSTSRRTTFAHRRSAQDDSWFSIARALIGAVSIFGVSFSAHAQLAPEKAQATFQADPSLKVELTAAEPQIESPCALAFDQKGRLFVAENRGYPNLSDPPQGRIALLEDRDHDGRYETRTTFAEGLTFPNGVLPWNGGLIVTCAPDVLFLQDTDGDGRADVRRVLLTGFDAAKSTQLRVNAPTVGPDGWIYFAAGLVGGEITSPEHPEKPALKMTADLRWNPQTGDFENTDGKSQFGQSFDDFGRRFICMNRLPVQHVVLASKWLRRNPRLAFSDTVQDCNERNVKTGLKGGGDGVRLFPVSSNITTADSHAGSFSAACGITIWRGGSALPAIFDGAALACDPTGNLVHADRLVPRGATFAAEPLLKGHELLASSDDWFRPVFLARGPDGALYVADMYRRVIEHPDYLPEEVRKHTDFESGRSFGRIWRITAKEPRTAQPLAAWRDEFAELAGKEDARARFLSVLKMGDDPAATAPLAEAAARDIEDRWLRAAALSGIAGREAEFLRALWPKLTGTSVGELELLAGIGKSFADPAALLATLETLPGENATARAALLVDVRGGEKSPAFAKVIDAALTSVADEKTAAPARLLFIRLLARSTWDRAAAPLQSLLTNADDTLRTAAIRSLATLDANRAASILLAPGAWPRYSPALRETVLAALLARPAQIGGTLDALETGNLPPAALTPQRRQLFVKHADANIRERAAKIFAASETTPAAAQANVQAALALTPHADHGRAVFKQTCATCHRLEQEGVTVGPDLLDIRKQPKENIAFHIISPDAEIAPAFTAYTAELKDGRAFAGILTSETPTSVALRQPGGAEETILRADLKSLTALPGSLMPAGLDAAMQPQDLADLLAFLKGEK